VPGVPHHLGYGITQAITLEGALKLKEVTNAHCADRFLSPILLILPAQLIACHLSMARAT
jgi:glucosamine 6-phosphate synthetase-like amidotransferase/phosphosugar isomerase protein